MESHASTVRGPRGLDPTTKRYLLRPQNATAPVTLSIKLWGKGFPTKLTVQGEREVIPIGHPMVMGFDGIAHLLHLFFFFFTFTLFDLPQNTKNDKTKYKER